MGGHYLDGGLPLFLNDQDESLIMLPTQWRMYQSGQARTFTLPAGTTLLNLTGLNNLGSFSGNVAGAAGDEAVTWDFGNHHSRTSELSHAAGITDDLTVAGASLVDSDGNTHAAWERNGQLHEFAQLGSFTVASDDGYMAGLYFDGSVTHGFVARGDTLSSITGFEGLVDPTIIAVNSHGWLIGSAGAPGDRSPFLYNGTSFLDVQVLLSPSLSGWTIDSLTDINDHGQILAVGTKDGFSHPIILSSVPEPASFAAMALGLGAFARLRRKGSAKSA
jgi:hypothetical protein